MCSENIGCPLLYMHVILGHTIYTLGKLEEAIYRVLISLMLRKKW